MITLYNTIIHTLHAIQMKIKKHETQERKRERERREMGDQSAIKSNSQAKSINQHRLNQLNSVPQLRPEIVSVGIVITTRKPLNKYQRENFFSNTVRCTPD